MKWAVTAFTLSTIVFANSANAIAINKCIRLVRNPQVRRETIINTCKVCMIAKVQRKRPGGVVGTPTQREFNLQPGTQLLLPFRGPGQTRISREAPCPSVR
ncbi:MAG: hypothetical protein JKY92_00535 [Magnetovibrio sp.]|nr:hypothetical protein [Magnetovibrio sp.]